VYSSNAGEIMPRLNFIIQYKTCTYVLISFILWINATFARKIFVQKRLWKSRCWKCKIYFLQQILQLSKKSCPPLWLVALFTFKRFWCKPAHVQSKSSSHFARRHWLCPVATGAMNPQAKLQAPKLKYEIL